MGVVRVTRANFYIVDLENFATASRRYRWYTQLDRSRFVYDTHNTMEATRSRHGWVHMFITHRPTLTLQLHNFDLFKIVQVFSALLLGNWQDFNWHDASRCPSAIAVFSQICAPIHNEDFSAKKTDIFTCRVGPTDSSFARKPSLKRLASACSTMNVQY